MPALTTYSPSETYKRLIQVSNIGNSGVDGTLRNLTDGEGNDLPIQFSSGIVKFTGDVSGFAIKSPDGSRWVPTISNVGILSWTLTP